MEDAAARRERLKALKAAAAAAEGGQAPAEQAPQQQEEPQVVLKFRNYNPVDNKKIEHEKVSGLCFFVNSHSNPALAYSEAPRTLLECASS